MPSSTSFYGQYTLSAGTPSDFGTSQWQDPSEVSWAYVAFSVVSALYLNVELIAKLITPTASGGWWAGPNFAAHFFIYLTNWTQCLLAHCSLVAALLAVDHVLRVKQGRVLEPGRLPWRYRWSWLMHNVSAALVFTVTIAFWPSIFDANDTGPNSLNYFTFSSHGGNSIYVLLLLVIHRVPRRPLHVLQPAVAAAAYLGFTAAYTELGGTTERGDTAFYPVLDWRQQPTAAALFAFDLVIGVPISFFVVVGVAVAREAVWRRWRRAGGLPDEEALLGGGPGRPGYDACS